MTLLKDVLFLLTNLYSTIDVLCRGVSYPVVYAIFEKKRCMTYTIFIFINIYMKDRFRISGCWHTAWIRRKTTSFYVLLVEYSINLRYGRPLSGYWHVMCTHRTNSRLTTSNFDVYRHVYI